MGDLLHSLRDHAPMPREFVAAYCKDCGTEVRSSIGPATAAANRAAAHYQDLAHNAEVLSALRQACVEIERWASDAFRCKSDDQVSFEKSWSVQDGKSYRAWEGFKRIAALPLTDLDPQPLGFCDE